MLCYFVASNIPMHVVKRMQKIQRNEFNFHRVDFAYKIWCSGSEELDNL